MADAFQNAADEIKQVCQTNNSTLGSITGTLQQGISMVEQQEETGASYFKSIGSEETVSPQPGRSIDGAAESSGRAGQIVASAEADRVEPESLKNKLTKYCLNSEHPKGKDKARVFKSALGFDLTNYEDLQHQIVFDSGKAVQKGIDQYGTRYEQRILVTGPNGAMKNVLCAFIRKLDEDFVRLTTAYVDNKKK